MCQKKATSLFPVTPHYTVTDYHYKYENNVMLDYSYLLIIHASFFISYSK
jgi:hypothetical protein